MNLLAMSFFGAVMILIIVGMRALAIHKLPKKVFLILWGVVTVRLLIPYSLGSAFSIYSLLEQLIPKAEAIRDISAIHFISIVPVNNMTSTGVNAASILVNPWMVIWAIGMMICTVFFAMAYIKYRREFKDSLPVNQEYARRWLKEHHLCRNIGIRQSNKISAPLTYGVFHPVILMPQNTDWDDENTLQYVLTHEYVHICRLDAMMKLILTATLCVHWFNPMVWIMYVLANRDIELSCDEIVIRRFGERVKSAYAMTLIRMEEVRSGLSPFYNNFSKNAIEERIVAIMKIKRTSLITVFVAVALIVGITIAFATSAPSGDSSAREDTDHNAASEAESNVVSDSAAHEHNVFAFNELDMWVTFLQTEINQMVLEEQLTREQADRAIAYYTQQVGTIQTVHSSDEIVSINIAADAKDSKTVAMVIDAAQLLYYPPSIDEIAEASIENRPFRELAGTVPVECNVSFSVVQADEP